LTGYSVQSFIVTLFYQIGLDEKPVELYNI